MHKVNLFLYIYSVPSEIVSSVSLSFDPIIGVLGDSITATCTIELYFNVPGCIIEYVYGFKTNLVAAGAGVKLYNFASLSPVNISSAGEYTCNVTVLANGPCQVNGSEQRSIPRASDAVTLRMQCA